MLHSDDGDATTRLPTLDVSCLDTLADLFEAEGEFLPEMIDLFLRQTGASLARAGVAVHADDAPALRGIAHSLRGVCGTIGALRMGALAAELERMLDETAASAGGPLVTLLSEEFDRARALLQRYSVKERA